MPFRVRLAWLAVAFTALAVLTSPALAQVIAPAPPLDPLPSQDEITAFSRAVGINETCTKAYLAANNNTFPKTLPTLTRFMVLAPAADLCSVGAIASAMNNAPAPNDAQITVYAQRTGSNPTCIHAFVLHANSLPITPVELRQFQELAPTEDFCSPQP